MLRMILAFLLLVLGVALGQPQTLSARLGFGKDLSGVFAATDAALNTALMRGRIALGLQEPDLDMGNGAGVSNVAEVSAEVAPTWGSAKRVKAKTLVTVDPKPKGDIRSSASVRMIDGLALERRNQGARFVQIDPSP